jgi:hypothetical protein
MMLGSPDAFVQKKMDSLASQTAFKRFMACLS